jgi:hypothetical protein
MQETFFYYTTGKALKGDTVTESRLETRDKQFIEHESKFINICGCPNANTNQIIENRGNRLSRLLTSNYNLTHYITQ